MRHSDPGNFGHLMVDDFLSAYTAGQPPASLPACALTHPAARAFLPDALIADLRLVLLDWCSCCRGAGFDPSQLGPKFCKRYKTHGGWLQGLTPLDSLELSACVFLFEIPQQQRRNSFSLRCRYKHGTCFRNVLLGHNSALSVAYFHPSRAMLAREFRESFLLKLGLAAVLKGPGFRRPSRTVWRQRVTPSTLTRAVAETKTCRSFCTRKLQE